MSDVYESTIPFDDRLKQLYEKEWGSWEALRKGFRWETPDTMNVAELICDRHAGEDRVAVYYETEDGRQDPLTYRTMKRRSNQFANHLEARGIQPGDRVAICSAGRPGTIISHLGIWKCGAVSVPLSTLFGEDALRYRLEDSGASLLVADGSNLETVREVAGTVEDLESVLVIGESARPDETSWEQVVAGESPDYQPVKTSAEDDWTVFYTSGTTGPPKGVVHAHRMILGHMTAYICLHCNADAPVDRVNWIPADWAWMAALGDTVCVSLYCGNSVLAHRSPGGFDPLKAYELIDEYDVNTLIFPPTALRMMRNELETPGEQYDFSSVDVIVSGTEKAGSDLPEWSERVFGAPTLEGYGQTEHTPLTITCEKYFESHRNIGREAPGVDLKLVDPESDFEPVEDGDVGEIVARAEENPSAFKHYLNKPEATREKFTEDREWLFTGDLARRTEAGYYEFVSRADDVIISSGYRMGPEEIEEAVVSHGAVADCAVIGIPHEVRGEIPKAYVVLGEDSIPGEELREEIIQHVKKRLSKYEYPRELEFIDELPTTTTGKVQRRELRIREGIAKE